MQALVIDKQPLVHVVVLNYQMREVTEQCLASLRGLTYPNLQIVVVDNNSDDGMEDSIKTRFSDVTFIQTGRNLGYTGGNNRGIDYAISENADYVLVLNPDTILVNPSFIEELVAYTEANANVGIVGPRVFLRSLDSVQNTVLFAPGMWRNILNWITYRVNPKSFQLSRGEVIDAQVLNGVCLLIRVDCLKQIGLFDENIFMYIEDAEMDFRARQSGWKIRYVPVDSVIHRQKLDGYHMTSQVSFLLKRNSVYFLCKAGKPVEAWGYATLSLLLLVARGLLTFRVKSLIQYLRFCRTLLASYRQILMREPFNRLFGPPYTFPKQ
jgi:GT2 family glycosyltransferase